MRLATAEARRMWRGIALACALGLAGASAGAGETGRPIHEPLPRADVIEFVLGNTVWTLFHEIGHTFVDEYDLPVLGKEEDAVDELATLFLIERYEQERAKPGERPPERHLMAATVGWLTSWDRTGGLEADELPMWDPHRLDIQRFYGMVCLLYGYDPTTFQVIADSARLPAERAETCAYEYSHASATWERVLRPHRLPGDGTRTAEQRGRLTVNFHPASDPALAEMRRDVMVSAAVDHAAAYINRAYGFKQDIPVDFEECGFDNAFWQPDLGRILVCYELLATFATWSVDQERQAVGRR